MRLRAIHLILFSVFAISTLNAQAQQTTTPELSPEGKKALNVLMTAEAFHSSHIGFGGELSPYVAAYRLVLNESNRVEALKYLLLNASKPGQLYALAALWDADFSLFLKEVERYKLDTSTIETLSGCIGGEEKVSIIVFRDDPSVVRFENQYQNFKEWKAKGKGDGGFLIDIAGGGYSSMFRGRALVRPN